MIIAVRKQLLDAVKKLRDTSEVPANVDNVALHKVAPRHAQAADRRGLEIGE